MRFTSRADRLRKLEKDVMELKKAVFYLLEYLGIEEDEEIEPFNIRFRKPVFKPQNQNDWECG